MSYITMLLAICPTCDRAQPVVLRGTALRMKPHHRREFSWVQTPQRRCPVRDVDARPLVKAWIAALRRHAEAEQKIAAHLRARAAKLVVEADCTEATVPKLLTRARIAEKVLAKVPT